MAERERMTDAGIIRMRRAGATLKEIERASGRGYRTFRHLLADVPRPPRRRVPDRVETAGERLIAEDAPAAVIRGCRVRVLSDDRATARRFLETLKRACHEMRARRDARPASGAPRA